MCISLCVYIDTYIYIHEYLCVCEFCYKYTVNVHVLTFLCSYVQLMLVFISIALGGCTSPYTGKEPLSRCLLVRDSSVILQNPQSAISSDGEEHVFMPQNTRKIRESGDRFRGKSWPVLNGRIINGKLKNVMYEHWKFGALKSTNGYSWLGFKLV